MDLSFLEDFANDVQTATSAAGSVIDLGQKAGLISAPTNYGPSVAPIMPGQSPAIPWSDYVSLGTTPFGYNYNSGSFYSPLISNVPSPPPAPNTDSSKLLGGSNLLLLLGAGVLVAVLALRK